MNIILNITKTELRKLFYSPVAWLVLIIFCIQCGMVFINCFDLLLYWKRAKIEASDLTLISLNSSQSVYHAAYSYIYLYIPLITMGIMSQEFSTGSIKLLYSSPVTNSQIVIGKYLALLCFNLVITGILFVFSIYIIFSIKNVDTIIIFCALLGFILLLAVYAAIGLFMSSLSSYIVVAALGTFAIFTVLSFVGTLGQSIEFVRDITYWFSINSRISGFNNGLINSEDVIYFIVIAGMFLCLTIFRLKFKRQPSTFRRKLITYGTVISVVIFIAYLSSRPDLEGYIDLSRNKVNTLTKGSQEIVSKLPKDVTITTYVNVLAKSAGYFIPERFKSEQTRYEQYIRFKPRLNLKYVYYYHKVNDYSLYGRKSQLSEKEMLDSVMDVNRWDFDVIPYADIQPKVDLSAENFEQISLIQGSNNRNVWLRTYDDMLVMPLEGEISAALKRLNQPTPIVGAVTGHGERSISKGYNLGYTWFTTIKRFRNSLVNQGLDLHDVSLDRSVDSNISILMIAEPKMAFTVQQTQHLRDYIASGKNLIILGEHGAEEYLNPVLNDLGLQLLPGVLVDTTQQNEPDLMGLKPSAKTISFSPYFNDMSLRKQILYMPSTTGIKILDNKEYKKEILFESGDKSWVETRKLDFKRDSLSCIDNPKENIKAYPTVVALSRKVNGKTQKIMVTGDADLFSNGTLMQSFQGNSSGNYLFIMAAFSWLSDGIAPIDIHRPLGIDNDLTINDKIWDISSFIFRWLFPLVLIMATLIIYIRRKSR